VGTILVLLVVGLVVGALARAVLPGRQALPIWLTMLIGAGSLVLELIVGVVVAAAIIALTQGGIRAKSTTRV
jgi:uncharacterized membrane protein YeaQ/YmgE (transglycosylase-associated protein family)